MDIEGRINDAGRFFGCSEVKTFQSDVVKNVLKGETFFLWHRPGLENPLHSS